MTMKKKLFSMICAICMMFTLLPVTVFAEEFGDFSYTSFSENTVKITKYKGSESNVLIPSEINGKQVVRIDNFSFYNLNTLESISIPAGISLIPDNAVYDCNNFMSFIVDENNSTFSSLNGVLFSKDKTELEIYPMGKSDVSYSIPNSVTTIMENAFSACTKLKNVEIPSSVTTIVNDAFAYFSNLESVSFQTNSQLQNIGDRAFRNCVGLTSIEIPFSVTSIGQFAFKGCDRLERIFLPEKGNLVIDYDAIPDSTTKVNYELNENNKVTITEITLGTGKDTVAIPDTICGYEVVAVANSEWSIVGAHTCKSEQATCTQKAKCDICGEEYGELAKHSLVKTEAKDATCTEDGNIEYWTCSVCHKIFSDEQCTTEISLADTVSKAIGHTLNKVNAKDSTVAAVGNIEYWQCDDCDETFSDSEGTHPIEVEETVVRKKRPSIIEGTDQTIKAGEKKALTFRSNAEFADFIEVKIDGKTLDPKHYTVKKGSTIVTVKAYYVSTLSVGTHTIDIVSEGGTAETTFTIQAKKTVDTSDRTSLLMWSGIMLMSVSLITVLGAFRKHISGKNL